MECDHFFMCCVNRGHDPKAMETLMKQIQSTIKYVRKMGTPFVFYFHQTLNSNLFVNGQKTKS